MKRSNLRFILAVIFAVTGVIAWNLWGDGAETSLSISDLPDLPTDLAPAPMVEVVVPASLSETKDTTPEALCKLVQQRATDAIGVVVVRGRGVTTVPIFLLVPQTKLPKRLDLARDTERAQDALSGAVVAKWVQAQI
ncbi:MAG: hypothetical protein JJT99_00840 [Rhodobacteraceae bacterium]|nr:hypothetical protein [Paracoccaceae bacterium]